MAKLKLRKIIIFLFFFLISCVNIFSFDTFPTAALKCGVDKMEIGEIIKVDVYITIPDFVELLTNEQDIFIDGWEIQDFVFKQDITNDSQYILTLFITTFDSRMTRIPKIRLSFINKEDLSDSDIGENKFYFFSNSVPIQVNSIVQKYNNTGIFDIKNIKTLSIPVLFYVLCCLFMLFVLIVIYGTVFKIKINKNTKITLSPKEKAIRKLNNIFYGKSFDINKIKEYCFVTSESLRTFICDSLKIKKLEMTTDEILSVISDKNNMFYSSYPQVAYFFKKYDDVKYSTSLVYGNEFVDTFNKTKSFIENFSTYNYEENK
jgi:hypothetical protein